MIAVLLALAVTTLLGLAALGAATGSLRLARMAVESEQAHYLANAGMEAVRARATGGTVLTPGTTLESMAVANGKTGSYSITLTDEGGGAFRIQSVGSFGSSTRRVSALYHGPNAPPPAYQRLVFSNGDIALDNNTNICGDLYASGNLTLSARSTVWSLTTAEDPASPCASIYGSGKAMAAGRARFIGLSQAMGGWCDATHYGTGFACAAPPAPLSMAPPDHADMKSRATESYLLDCSGQPAGTCTQVPSGYTHLLSGAQGPYDSALIYVEGNIQVPATGATLEGVATYAATGSIAFAGDALQVPACTLPGATCALGWVAQGPISAGNRVRVFGTFISTDSASGFSWGNFAEVHGVILAPRVGSGNHGIFYPVASQEVVLPPGLPAASPPGGFSEWTEG